MTRKQAINQRHLAYALKVMNNYRQNFSELEDKIKMDELEKLQEEETMKGNKLVFVDPTKIRSISNQKLLQYKNRDGTLIAYPSISPQKKNPDTLRSNVANAKQSFNYAKIGGNSNNR